jgi:hypothetical protein
MVGARDSITYFRDGMKKFLYIVCFITIALQPLYAANPLIGVAGISGDSPRAINLAGMVERHLFNIINTVGVFEQVNHSLLRDELGRFNCVEDSCVLRFARTAKLSVIIRGDVEDRGDTAVLTLYAIGIEVPYFGSLIHRYRVAIPISGLQLSAREFSYIFEEHSGHFISGMIERFKFPLSVKRDGERMVIDYRGDLRGAFTVYRFGSEISDGSVIRSFREIGRVEISDGLIHEGGPTASALAEGDFILISFESKARFLEDFYYGRKREIVFETPEFGDTLYTLLFTVPASMTMPVVVPIIGYYQYGDYTGLALWAVNVFPYLYIEYDGLTNRPQELRDEKKSISRREATHYYFGVYMLLFGGMSLFVDAFANCYLYLSSNYQYPQPLMGNSLTAAYLSVVSGGGGHFYRGYRSWGYLYFHIDNLLLYYTIRAFTPEERYNRETGAYEKGDVDKERAFTLLGVLGFVKIVEVIHVLLIRDNIKNGTMLEGEFALQPLLRMDEERRLSLGLQYCYRF